MQAEASVLLVRADRPPVQNLRWSAVLAGLVVLIAAELVLLMLGAAIGLAAFDAGVRIGQSALITSATVAAMTCVVIASGVGGYVAARASGMRRTPDGILHGVLAWGAATVAVLLLAVSAGDTLNESLQPERAAGDQATRALDIDERLALADALERRLGLTMAEADSVIDQIATLSSRGEGAAADRTASDRAQALRAAASAGEWLSGALLLSLIAAAGGGALGSRGARRVVRTPPSAESLFAGG